MQFELLAGYRVVRKLGVGARAEIFLGLPPLNETRTSETGLAETGPADTPSVEGSRDIAVALKLFRAATPAESMNTEVAALSRLEHPHLLQLRDLASLTNGRPCLVLERLGRGSLAQLLEGRVMVSPGEAVTILAPIAVAVSAMHGDGVAHRAIRSAAIFFRASGAPVLAGFGHAALIPAGATIAALAGEPAVIEDYRALARLTRVVLDRVNGEKAERVIRWLDHITTDGYPDMFAEVLAERIFDLGNAEPVLPVDDSRGLAQAIPARIPIRRAGNASARASGDQGDVRATNPVSTVGITIGSLRSLLNRAPLPSAVRASIERLAATRKSVWLVGAAAALLATVLLLVVVPASPSERSTGSPVGSIPSPSPTDPVQSGDDAAELLAVTGDDPIAALAVLLETRARCIRDLSVLCLDSALQGGSAAMDHDVALIRSLKDGGDAPDSDPMSAGSIVERNGDAALLSVGGQPDEENPDEVLMVRGEAGWRIRAYLPSLTKSPALP